MTASFVKFNKKDRPEFYKELNQRVNKYFKENDISKYANLNMKLKTVFMVSLYFIPFALLLFGGFTSIWTITALWAIMGFGMSGIGLSIMHDANHGSYSKNKNVNRALGTFINFIGGYHVTWKIQHNVLHHSFTNIHELDEDLNQKVMRLSPNQERKAFHRYQAYYTPFLYGLLSIFRFLVKDFQQLFRYHKSNLLGGQGHTFNTAFAQIIFNKVTYFIVTFVLPIIILDFPWWQLLLGFLLMHFICGLILAFVFQPAHVVDENDFFVVDENGSLENNWAIHEMKTTTNFANDSTIFTWLVGGLNYQIEHHLFPNVCHVHYRDISKIVKATAQEFDVPYYVHKTFFDALKSHFQFLHELGTGEYDRKKAKLVLAK